MRLKHSKCRQGIGTLVIFFFIYAPLIRAASRPNLEELTLRRAVEIAYESSPTIQEAQMAWEEAKETYDSAMRNLLYPTLSLSLNLDSNSSAYHRVPGGDSWSNRSTNGTYRRGVFDGSLSLSLSEYTLFNSWLDTIAAKQAEISKETAAIAYNRSKRDLRYKVISDYYALFSVLKDQEIAQRDLAFAKGILRLMIAKKPKEQVDSPEIQAAQQEVSSAEQRLLEAKSQRFEAQYNLRELLGLETYMEFKLKTDPKYYSINMTLDQVKAIYETNSEDLMLAKFTLENSKLDEDKAQREAFPVKVSLSGVAWKHEMGYYSEGSNITTGSEPDGNFETSLSVSVSIPLWGPGGFLNLAARKQKLFTRKKNETALKNLRTNNLMEIESTYAKILASDEEIKVTNKNLLNQTQALSQKMLNPPSGETQWLEMKNLMTEVRTVESDYYKKLIEFNETVVNLSKLIGLDLTETNL